MHELIFRRSLLLLLLVLISREVTAQNLNVQGARHTVGISLAAIDHKSTNGNAPSEVLFDVQGIAVGLFYMGPRIRAHGLYGQPEKSRTLLDVSAMAWFQPSFARMERSNSTLSVPVGGLIAWRRVTLEKNVLAVNAILLGAGGELSYTLGRRARMQIRGIPFVGITGSEVADGIGLSWAADAEARLQIAEVFSSLGLTIGYTFRYQFWNVNGSRAFSNAVDEFYDYNGKVHAVAAGIWF